MGAFWAGTVYLSLSAVKSKERGYYMRRISGRIRFAVVLFGIALIYSPAFGEEKGQSNLGFFGAMRVALW